MKLGRVETGGKKNKTWQLLRTSAAEIACMYLLGCVCLRSTQAVQMMPPIADGEAYLTTTRKVENKTSKTEHAKQNQEVVQHNTTTTLQMWEL